MTEYYQYISLDLQETEPFLSLILPDTYNKSLSLIKNIEQMYQYLHQSLQKKIDLQLLLWLIILRKLLKNGTLHLLKGLYVRTNSQLTIIKIVRKPMNSLNLLRLIKFIEANECAF